MIAIDSRVSRNLVDAPQTSGAADPEAVSVRISLPLSPRSSHLDEQLCPTKAFPRVSCQLRPELEQWQLTSSDPVDFPAFDPQNLARLAEDFLQAYSTLLQLHPWYSTITKDREYATSITGLMSSDPVSPTNLLSGVKALREMFREVSFPC